MRIFKMPNTKQWKPPADVVQAWINENQFPDQIFCCHRKYHRNGDSGLVFNFKIKRGCYNDRELLKALEVKGSLCLSCGQVHCRSCQKGHVDKRCPPLNEASQCYKFTRMSATVRSCDYLVSHQFLNNFLLMLICPLRIMQGDPETTFKLERVDHKGFKNYLNSETKQHIDRLSTAVLPAVTNVGKLNNKRKRDIQTAFATIEENTRPYAAFMKGSICAWTNEEMVKAADDKPLTVVNVMEQMKKFREGPIAPGNCNGCNLVLDIAYYISVPVSFLVLHLHEKIHTASDWVKRSC